MGSVDLLHGPCSIRISGPSLRDEIDELLRSFRSQSRCVSTNHPLREAFSPVREDRPLGCDRQPLTVQDPRFDSVIVWLSIACLP
jgi:hypothetical protein